MNKSLEMKTQNAKKASLSQVAREIYLRGLASLSKCEEVATKGNDGQGFFLRPLK